MENSDTVAKRRKKKASWIETLISIGSLCWKHVHPTAQSHHTLCNSSWKLSFSVYSIWAFYERADIGKLSSWQTRAIGNNECLGLDKDSWMGGKNSIKNSIHYFFLFFPLELSVVSLKNILALYCRSWSPGKNLPPKSRHRRANKLLIMSSRSKILETFVKLSFQISTETKTGLNIECHNQRAFPGSFCSAAVE